MNNKRYWYWRDKIETILYVIAIILLLLCASSCATKKVAVSTATIDKSTIHIDTSKIVSYKKDIYNRGELEYTVIEMEEKTVEAIKDTSGRVITPAQKSVIERKITAKQKDSTFVSLDTVITQMSVVEEQRDIDTVSEEKIIPPNKTAMWVFFSLLLVTLVGAFFYIKRWVS